MDQENKNTTGAPAGDTTSALFVSARKKQLEQQETERRAREKEEQRLAAEAEVRRLEREVEDRRRKAEENARLAEEDARRIAEEARAKKLQAAENPDAVLGAAPAKPEVTLPQIPKVTMPTKASAPAAGGAVAVKALPNKKLLLIIGGVVAAVIIAIALIVTLGGGDDDYDSYDGEINLGSFYQSGTLGFELSYPSWWELEEDEAHQNLTLQSTYENGGLMIMDITAEIVEYMQSYDAEVITATEDVLTMFMESWELDTANIPPIQLQKAGDYVSGGMEYQTDSQYIRLDAEVIEDRMIVFLTVTEPDSIDSFVPEADAVIRSLYVNAEG